MQMLGKCRPWVTTQQARTHFFTTHREQIALEKGTHRHSAVFEKSEEISSEKTASPGLDGGSRPFYIFADQFKRHQMNLANFQSNQKNLANEKSEIVDVLNLPVTQDIQQKILAARVQLNGPDPYENGENRQQGSEVRSQTTHNGEVSELESSALNGEDSNIRDVKVDLNGKTNAKTASYILNDGKVESPYEPYWNPVPGDANM